MHMSHPDRHTTDIELVDAELRGEWFCSHYYRRLDGVIIDYFGDVEDENLVQV